MIRHVRGLELTEMRDSPECCGFGGTFAVKFGMISAAMGDVKSGNAQSTGAEYVTSIDPIFLMHIDFILRKKNAPMKTIHLASILASGAAQ